jgi:SAM-dependent methyltransferase
MSNGMRGGYDPSRFALLASLEERHFWFRARKTLISRLSARITSALPSGFRVLDFGCGTGSSLSALNAGAARGVVVGMDLFHQGLVVGMHRGHKNLVQADASLLPFGQVFRLIGSFDVIEHIPNDVDVLRDLSRLLTPGGHLLVTVPAHPGLWSKLDDLSHHCRRYTEKELRTKLIESGFEIVRVSPYMATILPIVWFHRKFWHNAEQCFEAEMQIVPIVNEILSGLLRLESEFVARGGRMPFGVSLVAIAKKGERSVA